MRNFEVIDFFLAQPTQKENVLKVYLKKNKATKRNPKIKQLLTTEEHIYSMRCSNKILAVENIFSYLSMLSLRPSQGSTKSFSVNTCPEMEILTARCWKLKIEVSLQISTIILGYFTINFNKILLGSSSQAQYKMPPSEPTKCSRSSQTLKLLTVRSN